MDTGHESAEALGLRERKKLRTRETIVRVALELFADQGFHETTIKQIADAADVSARTVSAYFPVKEQLVFHDSEETFASLEARLTERPASEYAIDAMRAWVDENMSAQDLDLEAARCRRQIIEANPTLLTYERGEMARFEQILAAGVAVDLGVPGDDLIPHMVASAAIAAFDALSREIKEASDGDPAEMLAQARALIDDAMTFVGGGVQALAARKQA